MRDDAAVKLKVAAEMYRDTRFYLVTRPRRGKRGRTGDWVYREIPRPT
jgi:hypothetical protein